MKNEMTLTAALMALEILARAAAHADEPSRRALMAQAADLLRESVQTADAGPSVGA